MTDEMVLTRLSLHRRLVSWSGSATSSPVNIDGGSVAVLYLPSFVGTAVKVDFLIDEANSTWARLNQDGSEFSIPVAAGANVMPPELFAVNGKVRFISTASETVEGSYHPVT